jgi:hypothetical protein
MPVAAIDLDGLEALFSIDLPLLKKKITVTNSGLIIKTVTIVHNWGEQKITTSLSTNGLGEDEAVGIKDGGFWKKLGGGVMHPGAALYRNDLKDIYKITKDKSENLKVSLTYAISLKMLSNLSAGEQENNKQYRYDNSFLHFAGQTLASSIFGEGASQYAADIHERDFTGVFTGVGEEAKLVDAYVDLVNNAWGRAFGKELSGKYGIDRETTWTDELSANFLNDVQDYFSKSYPGLKFNKFDKNSDFIKGFTKDLNSKLGNEKKP